jgi:hypothetical protein
MKKNDSTVAFWFTKTTREEQGASGEDAVDISSGKRIRSSDSAGFGNRFFLAGVPGV